MATANQSILGPEPVIAAVTPEKIRRLQKGAGLECAPRIVDPARDNQLRERARAEAQKWNPTGIRSRTAGLEKSWKGSYEAITKVCDWMLKLVQAHSAIPSEAKPMLDNSFMLRMALEESREGLKAAAELPQIEQTGSKPMPRAYAAAKSFLEAVDWRFDEHSFSVFTSGLQDEAPLDADETWALKSFMQFLLLEPLGAFSESVLANRVDAPKRATVDDCPARQVEAEDVPVLIKSLGLLADLDWKEEFEKVNQTDRILRQDPVGAYPQMDFESRESYRKAVAEMAERSDWTEEAIAHKVLTLAREAQVRPTGNQAATERRSHVGYYLVAEGRKVLRQAIGYKPALGAGLRDAILRQPHVFYLTGIELITLALMMVTVYNAPHVEVSGLLVLALFLFPAAECALAMMNHISTSLIPPKNLPKMDFSRGIPKERAAIVVVPTLLSNEAQVQRAVRDLEIRYLANDDENLSYALVTDVPDALEQFDEKDKLAPFCAKLIEQLNERYSDRTPFLLFHRNRTYNPAEGIWMGWERKRGKLLDFNSLLLNEHDAFPVKAGDPARLEGIRYVITLDLDTQLPRDAARRLIGTLAHPLNRAVIDPATNTVVQGYGILQPRVAISTQSAGRSRLAALFSGDTGFDIYTRAVSDVYQDLFGEGTFTGKGIYEVATFQKVLKHRFPCNALLSHDMIEGAYARAGLVSDVEVIDDYPSHFSAFSRRKHRWVRGDWQVVLWLLPRVPDCFGRMVRNPMNTISRWKIIDNLRRSLSEFAILVLFLCGWLVLPGHALYWTLATLGLIALPTYFRFALTLAQAGRSLLRRSFWRNLGSDFATAHATLFFRLAFLCHQGLLMLDAVVRTLVRMAVTHKSLLEWETAAEAEEMRAGKTSPAERYLDWMVLLSVAAGVLIAAVRPTSLAVAAPLLALWGSSKFVEQWLNRPGRAGVTEIGERDRDLLRRMALRTWRFFREYSNADENWLIPDIVEDNPPRIAHRTSTTNMGMLLDARLAACDLGFLTVEEFVTDTERTFQAIAQMPKHDGHLYNWYSTQTLEPIKPRFVSTVDNGNLLCSLWTLKSGCLETLHEPLFRPALWQSIVDHINLLEEILAAEPRYEGPCSAIRELKQRVLAYEPSEMKWARILPELEKELNAFEKKLACFQTAVEAGWWAHELCMRAGNLSRMVQDFAPWLQPQFSRFAERIEAVVPLPSLTLDCAPALNARVQQELAKLMEGQKAGSGLYAAIHFLRSALSRSASITQDLSKRLKDLAGEINTLAGGMDFKFLYNPKKKLLSIGYEAEEKRVSSYYYDLLASEARAAYFSAIARGDIPQEAWFHLQRSHTVYKREQVLVSWTGTMFEYLMPVLWMKTFPNTMLENSARTAVRAQQKYTKGRVPWGISECACSERNPDGIDYRYHAFGVPGLAFNGGSSADVVISPYSTFLALMADAASAMKNLRRMHGMGWLGPCGFYEAGDFTRSRIGKDKQFEIVRCWMAHHQGMSFVAAANILCDSPMQRRFHAEPRVAATERLLHEKAPEKLPIDLTIASTGDAFESSEAVQEKGSNEANYVPSPVNAGAGISNLPYADEQQAAPPLGEPHSVRSGD
jgi:cyclic beta-1,2-glucan synthetase